jgi:uncharacterized protein YecE (DUF72 family)
MKVRVGLCGFSMAMARYPFPVVEVQSTFYDPPADSVMQKWPRSLEYTMKVWQLVTHPPASPTYRRLGRALGKRERPGFFRDSAAVARGWQRSLECAELLSATALLFQCPASFRPEREHVRNMTRFFERVKRPKVRLLWEPRGADWVAQRELALSLCRDLDLVHVVDPFVTAPQARHPVYWRLHGIDGARYSYTAADLRKLRSMLAAAAPPGLAYVLFNNLPRLGDAKRFMRQPAPRRRA